jgi:hypothetical protein
MLSLAAARALETHEGSRKLFRATIARTGPCGRRAATIEREIAVNPIRTLAIFVSSFVFALPGPSVGGPCGDSDCDGIPDVLDKCSIDSRNATAPATCDSDTDGYGNVCDPDFNQDFSVNAVDFGMFFVPAFKGQDPAPWPQGLDMNCDGVVNATDFGMFFVPKFKGGFGGATPGPSGLACAGTVPCQ